MNEKVKELRKTLGLTLEKFGEKLGVGKNAISRIETGKSNLTDQMLKAICNVNWDGRHVNEDWLRGNSKDMFKADSGNELKALAEKYQMSSTEYTFFEKFFKLEPSRREEFFKTLDKIFSAVHAGDVPEATPAASMDIDAEVARYREELELEARHAAKSSVCEPEEKKHA